MSLTYERLTASLEQRERSHAYRKLQGRSEGVDFCSNDYLGFAQEGEIQKEISRILETYDAQLGSTGSRLISGNHPLFDTVEKMLGDFHQTESALIFNSGYDANIGFFSTIPQRGDTIIYDELCHASIRDGIRLSVSKGHSFTHNDVRELKSKLERSTGAVYVAVESVYSMDGDEAPLSELTALCTEYEAYLVVDEAHSTGIYGTQGEGRVVSLGIQDQIFARLHTFGKAMGAHGAAWFGSAVLTEFLINYCRPFIYTTGLPIHSLAHIQSAYTFLQDSPEIIHKLRSNIQFFNDEVVRQGIEGFLPSDSPIQCIILSGNETVIRVTGAIRSKGFDVRPILHPTVAEGKERIRICLHAFNTRDEIKELLQTLANELGKSI
jgi:8-amino-7-oxononanoate synthase